MLQGDEMRDLVDDIAKNGLQQPVVLWHGDDGELFLLDGRNRLKAMERAGIPFDADRDAVTVTGDPAAHVASANLYRRHVLKVDRGRIIVELAKHGHGVHVSRTRPKGGRGKKNVLKTKAPRASEKPESLPSDWGHPLFLHAAGHAPIALDIIVTGQRPQGWCKAFAFYPCVRVQLRRFLRRQVT
jgi:ParB/Sulfiredoxin domain